MSPRPPVVEEAAVPPTLGVVPLSQFGLSPGDLIDGSNVDQFTEQLSPGMIWAVKYGWRLHVTEAKSIELPRAYLEATERYSAQVKLKPNGLDLVNFTAGLPFPNIDANDPQAASKIMWNFSYGPCYTDDLDVQFADGFTGNIAPGQHMQSERHYIWDHLRRLYYNGRVFVDPKPIFPNDEGYRYKESFHPMLQPYDLKGVGGTFYRYLDSKRSDDSWLYLPQLRRVRRMSSAQRSDALFGQDLDVDSFYGYNGHVAWNDYRLLGEKVVFAPMHAQNVPAKWQDPEDYFFDDVWEPRRVWVIEAVSKLPQYAYSRRVILVDKETWVVTYSDIYDRAGQLWKIWVNMWSYRKKAIPTAQVSVYPDEMAFQNAIVMIDMQLAHATQGSLPSSNARGAEGWYLNMGERSGTTEDFFTIAHLIETGH